MAEEILVAELQIGISKLEATMQKAVSRADRQSAAIRKSLKGVEAAVRDLPAAFHEFNEALKETEKANKETEKAIKKTEQSAHSLNRTWQSVRTTLGSLGLLIGAREMIQFATSTIRAADSLSAINAQLTQFSGNAIVAQEQMAMIRKETERLGQNTVVGAQSFAMMSAAAEDTALEGAGVEHVFKALNTVAHATRMSTERYGNILNQVSQIMAKGRFQGEELTTMAENGIPAQAMLAKAMKTTGEAVAEMMKSGDVSSNNLVLLADEILRRYEPISEQVSNTIPSKFRVGMVKIKNELVDLASAFLESSEVLKAIGFDSNFEDILPDKDQLRKQIDQSVGELVRLAAIIDAVFLGIRQKIIEAWNAITSFIAKKTKEVSDSIAERNKNVIDMTKNILGGIFPGMKDDAKDASASIAQVGDEYEQLLNLAPKEGQPGLLEKAIAPKGKEYLDKLDQIKKDIDQFFGRVEDTTKNSEKKQTDTIDKAQTEREAKLNDALARLRKLVEESNKKIKDKNSDARKQEIKDEKHAADTILAMKKRYYKELRDQEDRYIEEAKKRRIDAAKELKDLIAANDARIAKEAAKAAEMANEAARTGKTVLPEMELADSQKLMKETVDNMRENIQDALGDVLTKAFRGQIDDVKDVFNTIADLAATLAGQMASAFVIDPLLKKIQASLGKELFSIGNFGVTGGQIAGGAMGGMAGGSIGGGIGGALGGRPGSIVGGSIMGGMMGGLTSGMAFGAMAGGGVFSVPAAAVGAAVGAIVGGITSAIQAGVFKSTSKTTIGVNTSAASTGGPSRMSPFGILNMFEEASGNEDVINAALTFIAETDTAIASYLNETQRAVVQQYLDAGIPEGNLVRAEEMDDAIAKAVALRYFHAITAIAGQDVATTVVGSPFGATAGDIGQIQQRANQALELLKIIEEFKAGPITQTAAAVKAINQEFQNLIDRATTLGIPTDDIIAEQQRQLAEITTNFNQDIATSILAIKDPVAAQFAELERQQEERRKNAVDAEANLTQLTELETLERERLNQQVAQSTTAAGQAVDTGLIARLNAFSNQTMSSTGQAIFNLQQTFNELKAAAEAAGLSTTQLTASFMQQASQMRQAAQEQVLGAIYSITDPFQASMLGVNQQVREFQRMATEGLIPQNLVDQFQQAATGQAQQQERDRRAAAAAEQRAASERRMAEAQRLRDQKQAEAERRRAEEQAAAEQRRAEREQLRQQAETFRQGVRQMLDPFKAGIMDINAQVKEFQELVRKGFISQGELNRYRRLMLGQNAAQEGLRRIQGGGGNAMTQIADAFSQFIQAGNPLAASVQRMRDLTEQFRNLADGARFLGLRTKDLEKSYLAQAKVIREETIEAIDSELASRRQAVTDVGDYIRNLKLGQENPMQMRFTEAREQFLEAARTGSLEDALGKAEQYRGIAQERFGTTPGYFAFRGEIERILGQLKDREQYRIEQERNRLIAQQEREMLMVANGRTTISLLQQNNREANATSRGIAELIASARRQEGLSQQTSSYLRRVVDKVRA